MGKKKFLIPLLSLLALTGCVKYNGLPPETADHEHTYSSEYSSDANQHWFAATCEHIEQRRGVEEHSFGNFVVSQEATLTTEGLRIRTCSVCGYKDQQIIDKLNNTSGNTGNNGHVDSNNNTWSVTGISCDKENIEMTVGDNPISVVATLTGEGSFPTSLAVSCDEVEKTTIVDEDETKVNVKIANISSAVVESGSAFTVSPIEAGETKITIVSTGNTNIKKVISLKINAKIESHSIELGENTIELNKGAQKVLTCNSTDNVTWTTSDSSVVSLENLTNSGVWLKGVKKSETPITITATICAGTAFEASARCEVTVVSNEQTVFDYYYINNQKLTNLKLYMWDGEGTNATWPGVELKEATYINKDLFEVYKITIDKDERNYENLIISGNDSDGKPVQTDDVSFSSFKLQNAFNIPLLPTDVLDGTRKASVKICSFNPQTDISNNNYVTLSMDEVTIFVGNSVNVNTYTSENEVIYEAISGDDTFEISNESKTGFTITAVKTGEALIKAKAGEASDSIIVHIIQDEQETYYFVNNYLWTDLKLFFFNENEDTHNASFPGVDLGEKAYTDEDGKDVYEVKFMKYADNWEAFIISGIDGTKEGRCQTEDIFFNKFETNNSVKIDRWTDDTSNKAKVKFGLYSPSNKPYLNVTGDTFVKTDTSTYLTVETNGENVSYSITSGSEYVELSNESKNGVNVTGKAAGTATIQVKVGEGENENTKTISIDVRDNGISYYFFMNNDGWTDVSAYLFKGESYKEKWPGQKMEVVDQDNDNKDVYMISFDKFEEDWEYIIFSGKVSEKTIQTVDIPLASLDGDMNCAYPTSWKDDKPNNYVKNYARIQQFDFLKIDNDSKSLHVNDEWKLNFISNKPVSIVNQDEDIVEVTKMDNYVNIKALKEGTATILVTINEGFDTITRTCEITVKDDSPEYVTYYFANAYAWSDLKVFFWNENGHNADFPGITLEGTPLKNSNGNDTFEIKFDSNNEAWTHCVISGIDGTYGWAKTDDIDFSLLTDEKNMISQNGWIGSEKSIGDKDIMKCGITTSEYVPFTDNIAFEVSNLEVELNETCELTVNATKDFTFEVTTNPEILNVTKNGNKLLVKGVGSIGNAEITAYIDKGTENEKKVTCSVNVVNAPTKYEYRITNIPNWYGNDGAILYAWCWGGRAGAGTWIKLSYDAQNGFVYFLDVSDTITDCKVCRFAPDGFTEPSFEAAIWNQSGNLSFDKRGAIYIE